MVPPMGPCCSNSQSERAEEAPQLSRATSSSLKLGPIPRAFPFPVPGTIISGDSIFCATGITSGDLVSGIKIENDEFISETLITHKSAGLKKTFKSRLILRSIFNPLFFLNSLLSISIIIFFALGTKLLILLPVI